jgi:osmotically-inducible protein OsmY
MRRVRLLCLCLIVLTGCVRQDTEILSRVGRKLAEKAQSSTADLRDKLPFRLTTASAEPALVDHIQQRLSTDKLLAASKIDVQVHGAEVELIGTVEREEQKNRAVDLAETTRGVEKVVISLQVRGDKIADN